MDSSETPGAVVIGLFQRGQEQLLLLAQVVSQAVTQVDDAGAQFLRFALGTRRQYFERGTQEIALPQHQETHFAGS